jgi:hypothetical protein
VIDALAYVVIAASLGYAAWALVAMIRNQPPREPYVIGAGVVELLVLVQTLVAIVMMIVEGLPDEFGTFVGYLVVAAVILPAGLFWALSEKSRWGTAVLVAAALVVPVLVIRLQQVWDGAGGG